MVTYEIEEHKPESSGVSLNDSCIMCIIKKNDLLKNRRSMD